MEWLEALAQSSCNCVSPQTSDSKVSSLRGPYSGGYRWNAVVVIKDHLISSDSFVYANTCQSTLFTFIVNAVKDLLFARDAEALQAENRSFSVLTNSNLRAAVRVR